MESSIAMVLCVLMPLPALAESADYRGILLGLEGVTGKKAVDSDAMTVKN
jgi:hypothetical protein